LHFRNVIEGVTLGVQSVRRERARALLQSNANPKEWLIMAFSRAPFDDKILSFQISKLAHPLRKSAAGPELIGRNSAEEKADAPEWTRLLRARRERPRSYCAANRDNEFSPPGLDCHATLAWGHVLATAGNDITLYSAVHRK
jgi:hypothetical protein